MGYFKNIIVSDLGAKNLVKLKDMALASTMFEEVELARSYQEVIGHLKSKKKLHFDLIITSYRFKSNELIKLIESIKSMKNKFGGALLMVLPNTVKLEEVGDHFFAGIDGFLLEPYGVTDLEEMYKLALSVSLFANDQRGEALEIILGQTLAEIKNSTSTGENQEPDGEESLETVKHVTLKLGNENTEAFKKIGSEKTLGEAQPTKIVGGNQSKADSFKEYSQSIANLENDFSKVNDKEIEEFLSKLKYPDSDIALIREGIYRVRKLLVEQGISVDSKELVSVAKEQGKKFDEDDALARLKKKMEAFGK